MAVFNEIGIGRWNRFIQKLTDMKGPAPAPQLSSEIAFIHEIFSGVETRYLEQWNRYGIAIQVLALAAVNGVMQLRNIPGSNLCVVIEKLYLANVNAAATFNLLELGAKTIDGGVALNGFVGRLDARTQGPQGCASLLTQGTNVSTAGATIAEVFLLPNTGTDYIFTPNQEITVMPGDAFQIVTGAVNTTVTASLIWRERFLEPAERI